MYIACLLWACNDEDYSVSPSHLLTFSTDSVKLDTCFSNIPTATKDFWVFNKSGKSIRLESIRQLRGNQSGFRVNVDGIFLGQTSGYQTTEVEVRAGDSIRVFVELTSKMTNQNDPKELSDELLFTLESGAQQSVILNAFSWDAEIHRDWKIKENTTLTGEKPLVIYGGLTVDTLATLTLEAGTTIYFRDEAALDVFGKLKCAGTAGNEVILRGYRLDNMFDYLPYDGVSGQWQGVRFHGSSYSNEMEYTDIHSAFDGVVLDSCSVETRKLRMRQCTIHNCQGYGLKTTSSWVELYNCQLTNTLHDCLSVDGGLCVMNNCTLAQFYPFDAERGAALSFKAETAPVELVCYNSIVTGYADDVIMGEQGDTLNAFAYEFHNSILRTPKVESEDSVAFVNVLFETSEDSINGAKHFAKIDADTQRYDFTLAENSPCIDAADPETSRPIDRKGKKRDERPDIGAFEREKETSNTTDNENRD